MKTEKRYKIIIKTDQYHAGIDPRFKGKREAIIESNLSLPKARKLLLEMYNEIVGCARPYAPNWGLAVIQSKPYNDGALPTFQDGTRAFGYDVYSYSIEVEDKEREQI